MQLKLVTSDDREEIKITVKLTNNVGADLVVDCSGVSEGLQ